MVTYKTRSIWKYLERKIYIKKQMEKNILRDIFEKE